MPDENKPWWMHTPVIVGSITALIAALVSLVTALDKSGWIDRTVTATEVAAPPAPALEITKSDAEPVTPRALRRDPQLLLSVDADIKLVELRLFDARRNPIGTGVANQFEPRAQADAVVMLDHTTGLTWLRNASEAVTAEGAALYVRELKSRNVAGHSDWRIPTLEEALSLMEPQAVNGAHLDPAIPRNFFVLQTADTAVDDRKWVVYFADGFVGTEKRDFFAPVLAVRSDPVTTVTAR